MTWKNFSNVFSFEDKRNGLVKFEKGSEIYIPQTWGVYQIKAIPWNYAPKEEEYFLSFFNFLSSTSIDQNDKLEISHGFKSRDLRLDLKKTRKTDSYRKLPILKTNSKEILTYLHLFPPFYIGKSDDVQRRFKEHHSGINSEIQAKISKFKLKNLFWFFQWTTCKDEQETSDLEAMLIWSHRPRLNSDFNITNGEKND